MILVISIVLFLYILLLIVLAIGWRIAMKQKQSGDESSMISVIVPVRNEGENIGNLLEGLIAQTHTHFEVIVIDDHSTDATVEIAKSFAGQSVRLIPNHGSGKKAAIATGISVSLGSIVVTTDGDCSVCKNWLVSIHRAFKDETVAMVVGAVSLRDEGRFFSTLQSIEFASLIGSGAATLALGKPSMCNGANLAFRKTVFYEVHGYEGGVHIPTGDDEFLMRKVAAVYPGGIAFVNDADSVVTTLPQPDVRSFVHQRLRWASKWKFNNDTATILLAVFIWLVQVSSLAVLLILSFRFEILLSLFLIKIVGESFLLMRFCKFLKMRWSWSAFFALQLIYPVYVIAIGLLSSFITYSWKGRNYRVFVKTNRTN
jgi:biofilm PGA synthesis N-glycosyltransferase PgaC